MKLIKAVVATVLYRRLFLMGLVASLFLVSGTGCVQRRFTIRSNPPGALVYIDDYEIGTTPVSTDFIYYGTRKIRLVKDGYETLTVLQPVPTPWYEYPILDFVSENVVPGEIRDERVLDYQLQPQVIVPREQLMGRAEELRRNTHSITPIPTLPPMPAQLNAPPLGEQLPPPPPAFDPSTSPTTPFVPSPPSTLPPPATGPGFDRFPN